MNTREYNGEFLSDFVMCDGFIIIYYTYDNALRRFRRRCEKLWREQGGQNRFTLAFDATIYPISSSIRLSMLQRPRGKKQQDKDARRPKPASEFRGEASSSG